MKKWQLTSGTTRGATRATGGELAIGAKTRATEDGAGEVLIERDQTEWIK